MTKVFSVKEIEILKLYLQKKKNKEIAKDLEVSEPYISQTLSKIRSKLKSLEDSLELLESLGMIDTTSSIRLTETGRKSFTKNLTSLEDFTKPKQIISKDTSLPKPYIPLLSSEVVGVTPIFKSPHESLKYTITELIKGIVNQSLESTRELSIRLGIAEDIIQEVQTIISSNPIGSHINTIYDYILGTGINSERIAIQRIEEQDIRTWWSYVPNKGYHDVNVVRVMASPLNSVSSTISMQLPSTGEHKHRTIITASNGLEGDIYGI